MDSRILELVLKSGARAPSARNSQPWHFTVVKNAQTMKTIVRDVLEGNVLIVVSGVDEADRSAAIAFDCALATENMYLAAQAFGLGAHIYTGPIATLNAKYRDLVGIPAGFLAVAILKIGNKEQKADALSAASPRRDESEVISTY